ncbi:hypothetical protein [Streptomyces sp. NPDC047928]|uniref:hypothetical protein n=1 Tax=unclassified Streptomyces TaxID=2593676 RepID=UPI0037179613
MNGPIRRAGSARLGGSAAIGAALVLATGCTVAAGGGTSGSGSGFRPVAEPSAAATAAGGLAGLAVSGKDIAGYTVEETAAGERVERKDVSTDGACAPLGYALAGAPVGEAKSTVARQAVGEAGTTDVTLGAYGGQDALAAMTALSDSADACSKGFTVQVKGDERQVTAVVREVAPSGTDQAMAFAVTTTSGGKKTLVKVVVLRKGDTLVQLTAPEVPQAVVDAQLLKLT